MEFLELPDWAQATVKALMEALKAHDPYTYGHCYRVARNSRLLARAAGLNIFEQRVAELSGLFHDIGKIGVPERILHKPGRLEEEEFKLMRSHSEMSYDIVNPLAQFPIFKAALPGIRHHHERIDGLGYPDGLSGDFIPMFARLVAVADSFDAMTTSRSYRKGLGPDYAYKEIERWSGEQFDAKFAQIFLESSKSWGDYEREIQEEFITQKFPKKVA